MFSAGNGDSQSEGPVAGSVAGSGREAATAKLIGARILEVRGSRNQEDFANGLGIHAGTLGRYERGERLPDTDFLIAMSVHEGINPHWLLLGVPPKAAAHSPDHGTKLAELAAVKDSGASAAELYQTAFIDQYDVNVGGGTGKVPLEGQAVRRQPFQRTYLRQEFNADEKDVYFLKVAGDSMAPMLNDGDFILIDTRESHVVREDVYVIQVEDTLLVKNVQLLPGGLLKVWSENEKVAPPFTVNLNDAHGFRVIGRVLWRSGKLRR